MNWNFIFVKIITLIDCTYFANLPQRLFRRNVKRIETSHHNAPLRIICLIYGQFNLNKISQSIDTMICRFRTNHLFLTFYNCVIGTISWFYELNKWDLYKCNAQTAWRTTMKKLRKFLFKYVAIRSESWILDILYTSLLAKSSAKPPDYHIAIKLATLYLQAKNEVNYMCNAEYISHEYKCTPIQSLI